ncbi:hypothetical protein HZB88_03535 [archaeon]|nr:hypothetical protein [archaeon]
MRFGEIEEEREVIPTTHKIKVKGVFDLNDLYLECHRWFEHYAYTWKEVEYKQTENPDGTKSVEIWWECTRQIEDYITFLIELQFQCLGYSEVEAKTDTGIKKMQKGTMEFRGGAKIVFDVGVWHKNGDKKDDWKPFGQLMARIYHTLIYKKIDEYEDILFAEVHKLYNEIRNFLGAEP